MDNDAGLIKNELPQSWQDKIKEFFKRLFSKDKNQSGGLENGRPAK